MAMVMPMMMAMAMTMIVAMDDNGDNDSHGNCNGVRTSLYGSRRTKSIHSGCVSTSDRINHADSCCQRKIDMCMDSGIDMCVDNIRTTTGIEMFIAMRMGMDIDT